MMHSGINKTTRSIWFLMVWFLAMAGVSCASAVEYSKAEVSGKYVTICRVDIRKDRLQLFYKDDTGRPFCRFDRLKSWLESRDKKLVFAMNAGMYHGDFSAVGLVISDGQLLAPLNTANGEGNFFLKPNGVFTITESGARVLETTEYSYLREKTILATQSGPMLVWKGRIHPAFNPSSESRLYRNGVGVPSPETAIFAISDVPLNLHEFAVLFRDKLRCPNALFLDGSVSSLYSSALNRSDFRMDLGPILGITEEGRKD